jgi:hypothetical protein
VVAEMRNGRDHQQLRDDRDVPGVDPGTRAHSSPVGPRDTVSPIDEAGLTRMREGRPAITAESLREVCTGRPAHNKVPRCVRLAAEVPMPVPGKIRKMVLREESIAHVGLTGAGATHEVRSRTVDPGAAMTARGPRRPVERIARS